MHILLLTADLAYGGAARQVCQLARAFVGERERTVTVAVLGAPTPLVLELRRAGVEVRTLGWLHGFDLGAPARLRALVAECRPDVIHVWGTPALRALALAVGRPSARLVVSDPLRPGDRRLGMLDRWLLGRCRHILVGSGAEAERCRRLGLPASKIAVVRPAVGGMAEPDAPARAQASDSMDVVCAGRMELHKGFREAIWAFDILHHVAPRLRLRLLGDGPERPTLERFADKINMRPRIDFAGEVADVSAALAAAAVVWVPSLAAAGVQVALEAQAPGRPVVASRVPELAEVIRDGETGCLVDPGDKVALARATRQLLQDPARGRRLGEAGRERVARDFSVPELVRRVQDLY